MIGDIRLELTKRLMTLLIKVSKGDTYLEKLEASYKTNLIVFFFVLTAFVGIFAKYMELNSFAKDAETAYRSMASSVNEAKELTRALRISNDEKGEKIADLKKQNAVYFEDIKILMVRLNELEDPPIIGECKKEPTKQSSD